MEEWERRVAPGQHEESTESVRGAGKNVAGGEREPSYKAGDGLPVLSP